MTKIELVGDLIRLTIIEKMDRMTEAELMKLYEHIRKNNKKK